VSNVVLDASALLALLNRETGAEQVEASLGDACIGAVNLSECLARLADSGVPEKTAWEIVSSLELEVVPFNAGHAREAARLKPLTRKQGLSLGDRACLALARLTKRPVLTADRSWKTLDVDVQVRVIRG
jgi:PIN domain nuclease of toxin-antitoxin system